MFGLPRERITLYMAAPLNDHSLTKLDGILMILNQKKE